MNYARRRLLSTARLVTLNSYRATHQTQHSHLPTQTTRLNLVLPILRQHLYCSGSELSMPATWRCATCNKRTSKRKRQPRLLQGYVMDVDSVDMAPRRSSRRRVRRKTASDDPPPDREEQEALTAALRNSREWLLLLLL